MYGGGGGACVGGGALCTLAYTGTGSPIIPIIIAVAALVIGGLLMLRSRMLRKQAAQAAR